MYKRKLEKPNLALKKIRAFNLLIPGALVMSLEIVAFFQPLNTSCIQPKPVIAGLEFQQESDKAKKNKSYVSKLTCAFVFWCAFDSAKFKVWIFFFFACLIFFSSFLWPLLVKIYKKRYDRHNEILWTTTDFFNSVFCLVSCSSKIKFHISKLWTTQIWHVCCSERKKKKKKEKETTHLGQVFQFVTSFET